MRITINKFTFLLPNRFIGFVLKKAVINEDLFGDKTEKEIQDLFKLVRKELIEFKKNGRIVLVDVKDSDGSRVKIVI
ncbi:MAG: hypothetical protein PHF62_02215 [Acholeplasmataceae bacterium]|nr:hypothetical protein [Acholeplasmataceae bacterium]MDD4203920.1 hypothetical protein [Acholeplasmataceae bacterium]MDD4468548.1 hypothetical protein [Acholeplasmataceae bacterium]